MYAKVKNSLHSRTESNLGAAIIAEYHDFLNISVPQVSDVITGHVQGASTAANIPKTVCLLTIYNKVRELYRIPQPQILMN